MTKTIKQDKNIAAVVASMVAGAVTADQPQATQAETPVTETTAVAVKAVKAIKAKAKKTTKASTKPTPAAKKAGKAAAKVAIKKAQTSARESTAIRSDKQGLTFGQWLKLLSNTAAKTGAKVPTTEAGLAKKFQPVYMAGTSVKAALAS